MSNATKIGYRSRHLRFACDNGYHGELIAYCGRWNGDGRAQSSSLSDFERNDKASDVIINLVLIIMSFEPIIRKTKPHRMRRVRRRGRSSSSPLPDGGIKPYPAYDGNTTLLFNAFREVHFAIAHKMRTFISSSRRPVSRNSGTCHYRSPATPPRVDEGTSFQERCAGFTLPNLWQWYQRRNRLAGTRNGTANRHIAAYP